MNHSSPVPKIILIFSHLHGKNTLKKAVFLSGGLVTSEVV